MPEVARPRRGGTMSMLEIVVLVAAAFVLGFAVGRMAGLRTGKKKSG